MQVLLVVSLLFLNRAAVRIEEAIILEVLLRQTGRVLVGQEREDLDSELLAIEVLIGHIIGDVFCGTCAHTQAEAQGESKDQRHCCSFHRNLVPFCNLSVLLNGACRTAGRQTRSTISVLSDALTENVHQVIRTECIRHPDALAVHVDAVAIGQDQGVPTCYGLTVQFIC